MTQHSDLRLPGSVAEVMASEAGPKIGAFFDLDGTLVAGFTAVILTRERFRSRDMGVGELISMIAAGLTHQFGGMEFESLINRASEALRGRAYSDLLQIGERLFKEKIEKRIYPEMRELVHAHLERGHTVVLSSSALTIQVEPVARFLDIPHTLTNRFEIDDDGILTGKVITPILWGQGKADAVQKFAAERGIDLDKSYFYADGDEDVALMYLVGNPRPTNPGDKMREVARKRGWPILEFNSRGRGGLIGQVRNLLGMSTVVPAAYGAIGWGLLTRSRRRGVNFFTTTFPQLLLAVNGVELNVLGAENLKKKRPAVFIFNHRNNFDPVVVGALVKDNWAGVGKKELQNDPIVGTIGKLVDTVFIDRDDPKSAVESLREAAEACFVESVEAAHSNQSAAGRVACSLGITRDPVRMDSQVKYAAVARGDASIYLRLPTKPGYEEKIWDHAAGSLVVTEANAKYHANVGYDTLVTVRTRISDLRGVRVRFDYEIVDEKRRLLVDGYTIHACVNIHSKPMKIPTELRNIFEQNLKP